MSLLHVPKTKGALHHVWFENSSSISQKVNLINRYELAGISLWRLGMEDAGLWPLLRSRWGSIEMEYWFP